MPLYKAIASTTNTLSDINGFSTPIFPISLMTLSKYPDSQSTDTAYILMLDE